MSDWQSKSDFEINKAVARVEGFFYESPSCTSVSLSAGSSVYLSRDNGWSKTVNYCNNPADAWPIILDNKIDIEFAVDHLGSIGQAHVYIEGDADIFCEFTDNNKALRAAMIVYLEMNGVKS